MSIFQQNDPQQEVLTQSSINDLLRIPGLNYNANGSINTTIRAAGQPLWNPYTVQGQVQAALGSAQSVSYQSGVSTTTGKTSRLLLFLGLGLAGVAAYKAVNKK